MASWTEWSVEEVGSLEGAVKQQQGKILWKSVADILSASAILGAPCRTPAACKSRWERRQLAFAPEPAPAAPEPARQEVEPEPAGCEEVEDQARLIMLAYVADSKERCIRAMDAIVEVCGESIVNAIAKNVDGQFVLRRHC